MSHATSNHVSLTTCQWGGYPKSVVAVSQTLNYFSVINGENVTQEVALGGTNEWLYICRKCHRQSPTKKTQYEAEIAWNKEMAFCELERAQLIQDS